MAWLRSFFKANSKDLESYFKITNINDAITRTIDDSEKLEAIMMDISPEANLDYLERWEQVPPAPLAIPDQNRKVQDKPQTINQF